MTRRERLARAIARADEQNGGPPWDMLMTMGKAVVEAAYDRADAVIGELREAELTKGEAKHGDLTLDDIRDYVKRNGGDPLAPPAVHMLVALLARVERLVEMNRYHDHGGMPGELAALETGSL